jgi:arylsulfatase A-like enzyme
MKNAGYTTGVTGKWGLGRPASTGHPNNQGFDYFYGYLGQVQAHHFYPDHLWENGNRVDIPENVNDNRGKYSHDLVTQKSLDFINQNKDNPFFLAITYTIPHAELLVPAEDLAVYQGQFDEKEYIGHHYHSQKYPKAAYAAMVTKMDRDIGKIKRLLEKLDIDKNSIVMFSSDNGPHEEGGNNPEFFNSNSKFRGIKRDLYEGGIRVPFIVNWPAKIKTARISDHISAFWDVLPTCADIAGTPAPSDINGISFLPELLGKKQSRHQYLYWEFPARGGRRAIRKGKWKAVQYDIFKGNDKIELYNLETDPGEENNLAQSHPEIVAQLKKLMREVRTPSEKFPFKNID